MGFSLHTSGSVGAPGSNPRGDPAEWRGSVSKEAIAEAVELAQRTFEDHAAEYAQEPQPA